MIKKILICMLAVIPLTCMAAISPSAKLGTANFTLNHNGNLTLNDGSSQEFNKTTNQIKNSDGDSILFKYKDNTCKVINGPDKGIKATVEDFDGSNITYHWSNGVIQTYHFNRYHTAGKLVTKHV